jgi:hypothetical protein
MFTMSTNRRQFLSLGCALAASAPFARVAFADGLAPGAILAKADDVRNPAESYFLRLGLDSGDGDPWDLEVSSNSNRQCLVKTLAPARERGRAMLMIDEDMWAYLPNLKRSVRVALNQRLTGQAANGDITRTRWAGDYTAALEADEANASRLLLTANKKGLTYEKIRTWIEHGTFRPLHAECLNLTGHPLKTLTYGKYKDLCGKVRPSEIVVADAVRTGDRSVMTIKAMELRKFPDSMFTPESLQ